MEPLSPEDMETTVDSGNVVYAVQVFPEGPIAFEELTDGVHNKIVIGHRIWPDMFAHAQVGNDGEVLERSQGGIATTITADGNGGGEIVQAYGDDIISLTPSAMETVNEHIQLTRFKLQGRGFDTEAGL